LRADPHFLARIQLGGTSHSRIAHHGERARIRMTTDARIKEWLGRLQANAPSVVTGVLAALIAVELARVAVTLLSGPVESPQPVFAASAPRLHVGVNIQAVVSAHLFGAPVSEPTAQDPDTVPSSTANLMLAGTIATENPKHGIAIISDGGPSKVFSVGDNVNGAPLYSVYIDHVILDRGGILETLQLPRMINGGSRAASRPPGGAGPRTVQGIGNAQQTVQQDSAVINTSSAMSSGALPRASPPGIGSAAPLPNIGKNPNE
jgi:type II secretory pathway component PulC